jgi:hypothetical protein
LRRRDQKIEKETGLTLIISKPIGFWFSRLAFVVDALQRMTAGDAFPIVLKANDENGLGVKGDAGSRFDGGYRQMTDIGVCTAEIEMKFHVHESVPTDTCCEFRHETSPEYWWSIR